MVSSPPSPGPPVATSPGSSSATRWTSPTPAGASSTCATSPRSPGAPLRSSRAQVRSSRRGRASTRACSHDPYRCATIPRLLSDQRRSNLRHQVYAHARIAAAHGLGYRVAELNSAANRGVHGVSDVAASALCSLWALQSMFDAACPQPPGVPRRRETRTTTRSISTRRRRWPRRRRHRSTTPSYCSRASHAPQVRIDGRPVAPDGTWPGFRPVVVATGGDRFDVQVGRAAAAVITLAPLADSVGA